MPTTAPQHATLDLIDRLGVTNLAGSPTAFRSMRAAGVPDGFAARCRLRALSNAGEPLPPDLLVWSRQALGTPIHDHYGQSELGMPVGFAHHPALRHPPQPGFMGTAAPGYRIVVLTDDGNEAARGADGELAVDVERSPLYWFRGYLDDPEKIAERFRHGPRYHLTGDTARAGDGGLLFSASRADDVITSSGYRIGPSDVESVLLTHEDVVEAAVVGTPDELRGEAVTAFVVPAPDATPGDALAEALRQRVRERLSKHLYPRRIVFIEALPRTPSGKVQRAVLRDRFVRGEFAPEVRAG